MTLQIDMNHFERYLLSHKRAQSHRAARCHSKRAWTDCHGIVNPFLGLLLNLTLTDFVIPCSSVTVLHSAEMEVVPPPSLGMDSSGTHTTTTTAAIFPGNLANGEDWEGTRRSLASHPLLDVAHSQFSFIQKIY
jgi:hypothetical protein